MHELTNVISQQMHVNMCSVNIKGDNGIYKGDISIYVPNTDVLKALLLKIKRVEGVKSVGRKNIS